MDVLETGVNLEQERKDDGMAWEFAVLDFIQKNMRNGILDTIMPMITSLGNGGIVWILLAVCLLISRKYRRTGVVLLAAILIETVLCNGILKPLIARPRPFDANPGIELLIAPPGDASFPSGHTALAFAAVFALALSRERYWYLAAVLAVLIAFSRMYLYVHYPTDILGGIAVGAVSGMAAYAVLGKRRKQSDVIRTEK